MTDEKDDEGVLFVLMDRLEKIRLPRALSLKEKVDGGAVLDDYDLAFLEEVFSDSSKIKSLVDRHPEYQELATRVVALYSEITEKALENEKSA